MESSTFFKAKVNNSYESEPSSGSGSSLSDNNDFLGLNVEKMDLAYLLKPRIYENQNKNMENNQASPNLTSQNSETPTLQKSVPTPAYISSQESPFYGFSESPFGKLHLRLQQRCEVSKTEEDFATSVTVDEKFYDSLIVNENSCNAVDLPLPSQEEEEEIKDISDRKYPSTNNDDLVGHQQAELSFNGKFKNLNVSTNETTTHQEHRLKKEEEKVKENSEMNSDTKKTTLEKFSQSFTLRNLNNEKSPDLFADDDDDDDDDGGEVNEQISEIIPEIAEQVTKPENSIKDGMLDSSANRSWNCPTESSFADEPTMDCMNENLDLAKRYYRDNCKRERELLRRIRICLSGVPPPPSLTTPQMDLINMVLSRKDDVLNFLKTPLNIESGKNMEENEFNSLFKPTHSLDEAKAMPWRNILGVRQHGLSYNLTKASENNEYLSLSVVDRFVGTETTSSYRRSPSSAKKRNARLKLLTQSPGNRLSHLAKRRAIFSSAHLATTSQKSASSFGPQIIIDKKKVKNRRKTTPKRKTPASKKKTRKTPTSSARKRLFRCEVNKPGPSRETSKRALFQSPAKHFERQLPIIPKLQIKPEIATRVEKSKRALFSPDTSESSNQLPSFSNVEPFKPLLKRKRDDNDDNGSDDDEGFVTQSSKYLRASTENLTPRALKIKSQSFCIGAGSSMSSSSLSYPVSASTSAKAFSRGNIALKTSSSTLSISSALSSSSLYADNVDKYNAMKDKLQRAQSDMAGTTTTTTGSLTENQRKKLLWAVSQALQEKKITTKHESFKQYASVLARVVRRIFQEYYQRTSLSNSETMLRLSKKYVYYVISGKSADDVYLHVKSKMDESKRLSTSRLTGYIGPEEYQQLKMRQQQHQQPQPQQLSQSSIDSSKYFLYSSENSIDFCSQSSLSNQCQMICSNDNTNSKSSSKKCPIETNPNQQNSSSKSNLGSLALRENSAQKNFTGKDQRNMSPYAKNPAFKPSSLISDSLQVASTAKAKRQILFDS